MCRSIYYFVDQQDPRDGVGVIWTTKKEIVLLLLLLFLLFINLALVLITPGTYDHVATNRTKQIAQKQRYESDWNIQPPGSTSDNSCKCDLFVL